MLLTQRSKNNDKPGFALQRSILAKFLIAILDEPDNVWNTAARIVIWKRPPFATFAIVTALTSIIGGRYGRRRNNSINFSGAARRFLTEDRGPGYKSPNLTLIGSIDAETNRFLAAYPIVYVRVARL